VWLGHLKTLSSSSEDSGQYAGNTVFEAVQKQIKFTLLCSDAVDQSDTSATADFRLNHEPFSNRGWHNALVQYVPSSNRKCLNGSHRIC
jgi:hypothetical protein